MGRINSYGDYGLVIIDTHGLPDGFLLGTKIKFSTPPTNEADIRDAVIQQAGQEFYDMFLNGEVGCYSDYGVVSNLDGYRYNQPSITEMEFYVTSKYINSRSLWSSTIVLGNMCYSGANTFGERPVYFSSIPIRSAFLNRDLISYYGYAKDNDRSDVVTDSLSKQMENLLVKSFLVDGDSTGAAHLDPDKLEYRDYRNPNLKFKHFNKENYCYGLCINVFTDNRDGIIYKSVCMGK